MSTNPPSTVLIIRHAEKPSHKGDPDLSEIGHQRAAMLAKELPKRYSISALFAAARSKESNRSHQTIKPLAATLGLHIDHAFSSHEHEELAKHVLRGPPPIADRTVLICWHHEKIPALARDFGATSAPSSWGDEVYDEIWRVEYSAKGEPTFSVHKQLPIAPNP